MGVVSFVRGALPFGGMVMVECCNVGISTISKAAMTRGMSNFVFIVYSHALAALIMLPYFIFHRKKRAPLTFPLLCVFFLLALIGTLSLICSFTGIKYGSPTLSAAIANLIPVFTFLVAISFRMEKLDFRTSSTKAKCLGTIITVSGAFIVTLYRGPSLLMASPPTDLNQLLLPHPSNWVLGGLLAAAAALFTSIWSIVQAETVVVYPEKMTTVFFTGFFVSIQCTVVSVLVERNPQAWKLKPDMEMIAIGVSAIFGSVVRLSVHIWCLFKKGPVYTAMFAPLEIVIAAVAGVTFLGDTLHLGSIIGAIVIAFGFYTVMWGKAKEEDKLVQDNQTCILNSSTDRAPLLSGFKEEI